jgi:hypothetical protein
MQSKLVYSTEMAAVTFKFIHVRVKSRLPVAHAMAPHSRFVPGASVRVLLGSPGMPLFSRARHEG